MFESISSQDAKTAPAEWLLARLTDPARAAAIYGDLVEISATRGRLWFWTAYFRAIISLGWRTGGSAFILAFLCLRFMFRTILPWLMSHRTPGLMDAGLFGENSPHVRIICWNLFLHIHRYPHVFRMPASWVVVSDFTSFAVAAIVCVSLYRRLFRQRQVIA